MAFSHLARSLGARADIAEATDKLNRHQIDRLAAATLRLLDGRSRVAVLGLSYKPETAVIEESQGVALAARLSEERREVYVHDPMALSGAMAVLQDKVVPLVSAEECVKVADVVVITTPWRQFSEIPAAAFARTQSRLQILDCWRILPRETLARLADIHYLGMCGTELPAKRVRAVASN